MLEEKRVLKKQKHTSFCISLIDSMIDISLTIQTLNVKTQNQAKGETCFFRPISTLAPYDHTFQPCSKIPQKLLDELRQTFIAGLKMHRPESDELKAVLNNNDYENYLDQTNQWKPIDDEENVEQPVIRNVVFDRFRQEVSINWSVDSSCPLGYEYCFSKKRQLFRANLASETSSLREVSRCV